MISTTTTKPAQPENQSTSSSTLPVSDITGLPVDTSSEAWRFECECRWILDHLPNKFERREYLESLETKRGKPAADRLRDGMMKICQARKARL